MAIAIRRTAPDRQMDKSNHRARNAQSTALAALGACPEQKFQQNWWTRLPPVAGNGHCDFCVLKALRSEKGVSCYGFELAIRSLNRTCRDRSVASADLFAKLSRFAHAHVQTSYWCECSILSAAVNSRSRPDVLFSILHSSLNPQQQSKG